MDETIPTAVVEFVSAGTETVVSVTKCNTAMAIGILVGASTLCLVGGAWLGYRSGTKKKIVAVDTTLIKMPITDSKAGSAGNPAVV